MSGVVDINISISGQSSVSMDTLRKALETAIDKIDANLDRKYDDVERASIMNVYGENQSLIYATPDRGWVML